MTSDDVFTVLADPTRRRILDALRAGENSVGDLVQALEVSQPTVSKHLKVLREAGVVRMRADGQRRIYAVESHALHRAARWLSAFPAPAAGTAPAAVAREEYKRTGADGNALSDAATVAGTGADATARALEAAASYRAAQQAQRDQAVAAGRAATERENPVVPGSGHHQQPLGRSVGRTVEQVTGRAQDLLERLQKPKFGRRR
ncbi:ArsR/SmtB family transcription factor [Arthrobacter sp. JSM 101049]|uniref:ArsR/SmtB family transcription factor n=1 Tax=Arthrobacter sp. JSM 101049 TaxID=929097 RepID=UPI0035647E35